MYIEVRMLYSIDAIQQRIKDSYFNWAAVSLKATLPGAQ